MPAPFFKGKDSMEQFFFRAVQSLPLCLLCGAAASAAWLWGSRQRLRLSGPACLLLAAVHTLAGVLCVKLFAGLESLGNPLTSGNSLFGAVFFLPLFYAAGARLSGRRFGDVCDVFAPCTISTLIFARLSCIGSGCCLGAPLPWDASGRWPTRELEMLFHGVLLLCLARRNRRAPRSGTAWPVYMIAYGGFRFLEEWLRDGTPVLGPLHRGHIWSLLSILIGCAVWLELQAQAQRKAGRTGRKQRR